MLKPRNHQEQNCRQPGQPSVGAEPESSDDISSKHGKEEEMSEYSAAVKVATNAVSSGVFYHLTGELCSATLLKKKQNMDDECPAHL